MKNLVKTSGEILSEINEDLTQVNYLLSSLSDDMLVDEDHLIERFIKLRENEEIVRYKTIERVNRINYNISLLNDRLKNKKPFTKDDLQFSNDNIVDYIHNFSDLNNRIHWVLGDKLVSYKTKDDLKKLHNEMIEKHLEFKKLIPVYNEAFPNNTLLTIEDAKGIVDDRMKTSIDYT